MFGTFAFVPMLLDLLQLTNRMSSCHNEHLQTSKSKKQCTQFSVGGVKLYTFGHERCKYVMMETLCVSPSANTREYQR